MLGRTLQDTQLLKLYRYKLLCLSCCYTMMYYYLHFNFLACTSGQQSYYLNYFYSHVILQCFKKPKSSKTDHIQYTLIPYHPPSKLQYKVGFSSTVKFLQTVCLDLHCSLKIWGITNLYLNKCAWSFLAGQTTQQNEAASVYTAMSTYTFFGNNFH